MPHREWFASLPYLPPPTPTLMEKVGLLIADVQEDIRVEHAACFSLRAQPDGVEAARAIQGVPETPIPELMAGVLFDRSA